MKEQKTAEVSLVAGTDKHLAKVKENHATWGQVELSRIETAKAILGRYLQEMMLEYYVSRLTLDDPLNLKIVDKETRGLLCSSLNEPVIAAYQRYAQAFIKTGGRQKDLLSRDDFEWQTERNVDRVFFRFRATSFRSCCSTLGER